MAVVFNHFQQVKNNPWLDDTMKIKHAKKIFLQCIIGALKYIKRYYILEMWSKACCDSKLIAVELARFYFVIFSLSIRITF